MSTKKKTSCFSPSDISALKTYAAFCFAVLFALIALNVQRFANDQATPFLWVSFSINIAGLAAVAILYFHPDWWQLWTALHTIQAIKIGIWDNDSLSLLMYLTGWVIAARAGFFERMFKRRITAVTIIFIFIFTKNLSYNVPYFVSEITKFALFCAMFALAAQFIIKKQQEQKSDDAEIPSPHTEPINLANYELTQNQEYYVYAILEKIPYKTIAKELCKSESSIKRDMLILFELFGVKTHKQLYELIKTSGVMYSKFTPHYEFEE
jgi:DNA-binding CsgD family transcriptional regulator